MKDPGLIERARRKVGSLFIGKGRMMEELTYISRGQALYVEVYDDGTIYTLSRDIQGDISTKSNLNQKHVNRTHRQVRSRVNKIMEKI